MSANPERLFLGTKLIISDRRTCLSIETIQALECLKSWLGLVKVQEDDLEDEDKIINTLGDTQEGFVDIKTINRLYKA